MSLNLTVLPGLSVRSPFVPRLSTRSCRVRVVQRSHGQIKAHKDVRAPQQSLQQTGVQLTGAAGLLVPLMMSNSAMAATPDGEHLLKGTLVSLIHPALMDFLFLATLWTGYLGWQWRRTRTIPEELKELRKQLPPNDEEGNRPVTKIDGRIAALEEQRKVMSKKDYKGVHHNFGGLLMGLGTATAVAGPVNTYLRSGKLFPGPHLYAGAAIVTLWAGAGAMVPLMAKGNNAARTAHITFNITNLLLFAWQIPTGLEIVGKVLQFTSLP
ncbi:TPA: hypothetical protein ACH3X2_006905 [Trebouxia sp. C0005]